MSFNRLEWRRLWRERNQKKGLRADGKPWKRPVRDDNWRKKLAQRCSKAYRARLMACGLNSHGRPPRNSTMTKWELLWRRFKASLQCRNFSKA